MEVLQDPRSKHKLQAIRVIQLAFGDLTAPGTEGTVWEGYTFRNPQKRIPSPALIKALEINLRNNDPALDREVARTLVDLNRGEHAISARRVRDALVSQITDESSVENDIHYLALLARTHEAWAEWDQRYMVNFLIKFEKKVLKNKIQRDTNWPLRMEEILEVLGKANPELAVGVLYHNDFGRPEHLLLLKLGIPSSQAARHFLKAAEKDPAYEWTPGLVLTLGGLPLKDTRATLERLWEQSHLRDAIVTVLADEPTVDDRARFVVGLASFDPNVVRISAHVLTKLSRPPQPAELAAAIKALRRSALEDKTTREAVASLLRAWSGESFAPDPKAWSEWALKKYPDVQKLLTANDGFDPVAWKKREAAIPWPQGDAARGRLVFTKATCAACHNGARAMGPSLQGVSKRFSRDDLLTAVLEPSKDVSPRYRPVSVTTSDDKVTIGMIVYEATDGVMLQTGPDTIVRIAGDKIASRRSVDISLMPAGLLDKLTDTEVADLFAYLKTLDK